MSARTRSTLRATATIVVAALLYEAVARTGYFPPALMPTLPKVWNALVGSLMDGTMIVHAGSTLYRVLVGLGLAVVVGLPLGILMARWKPIENFFMPLVSALMPIPSLAWVPVFILWFGLGNTVAILIVFYAALFPMLLNTWSGVRAVNPIWLRAAGARGANERARHGRKRRQEGRRENAAARGGFLDPCGDRYGRGRADHRSDALGGCAHDIMPQRTTVNSSSR